MGGGGDSIEMISWRNEDRFQGTVAVDKGSAPAVEVEVSSGKGAEVVSEKGWFEAKRAAAEVGEEEGDERGEEDDGDTDKEEDGEEAEEGGKEEDDDEG